MTNRWSDQRFRILVATVAVVGVTQGLLIPLITTLLERQGYNATQNGMSAAALYVGVLLMASLGPRMVKMLGYKNSILIGLIITTTSVFLFPLFSSIWVWSFLRFIVGMGDGLLHYATQLWITTTASAALRGKRISQYGFAYGLGFGVGPLGMNLLHFGQAVPFLCTGVVMLVVISFAWKLDGGQLSPSSLEAVKEVEQPVRLSRIYRIGIVALCPAILYGFLEAAIAGSFPIIGLHAGLSTGWISILISAFVWGSLVLQIPLGILGDKIGRKQVLIGVCFLGSLGMASIPLVIDHLYLLWVVFALTGGLIGSIFSLGLAYLSDLFPSRFLSKANALASIHFSMGSIMGPYLGGIFIQYLGANSLFFFVALALIGFVVLAVVYPEGRVEETVRDRVAA